MSSSVKDHILDVAALSVCACCEEDRFFQGLHRRHGRIVHQRNGYVFRHTANHLVCLSCIGRDLKPPRWYVGDSPRWITPVISGMQEAFANLNDLIAVQPMTEHDAQVFHLDFESMSASKAKEILMSIGEREWCACCERDCMKCGTVQYLGTVEHRRPRYTLRHTAFHNVCHECAERRLVPPTAVLYTFTAEQGDIGGIAALEEHAEDILRSYEQHAWKIVLDTVAPDPEVPRDVIAQSMTMVKYRSEGPAHKFNRVTDDLGS